MFPEKYKSESQSIATYSFTDIASGTGYIELYAGDTVDLKLLSNYTYYSEVGGYGANPVSGTATKLIDIDFDVMINKITTLQGIGIINIPVSVQASSSSVTMYIVARLRKWNGAVETEIANNQSSNFTSSGTSINYKMLSIDLNISQTNYKTGEYLRLTIEGWLWGYTSGYGSFYCDPKGRTSIGDPTGVVPSRLTFQCPIKIDA